MENETTRKRDSTETEEPLPGWTDQHGKRRNELSR